MADATLFHLDFNGFLLCLIRFWNLKIQHTVFEIGFDVVFIDVVGQCKAAGETSIVPLDAVKFFPLFFLFLFSVPPDGEDPIVYGNTDAISLSPFSTSLLPGIGNVFHSIGLYFWEIMERETF